MRAFLATTIGVACTAALALPFAVPTGAAAHSGRSVRPAHPTAHTTVRATASEPLGSTRTLPLVPLAPATDRAAGGSAEQGLAARQVAPFSLVGVTWDDPAAHLDAAVQVRTRAAGTGAWSGWQAVEAHTDDAPDPGDRQGRGATSPLWVGDSDGVQVRVRPGASGDRSGTSATSLPGGLRLEMVDPGDDGPAGPADTPDSPVQDGRVVEPVAVPGAAPVTELPELSKEETEAAAGGTRYIGARPRIITRAGWGADEKLREPGFVYTNTVKAVFVHHSATGNGYSCAGAPALIRSIYRYHVQSSGWRDIGYNFLVDKCGNIYEGRAGGVAKPVFGAHTLGFNTDSMGVAVLGTYSSVAAPAAALRAVSRLAAWKLGLSGGNPVATTHLVSGGGNLYKKGTSVRLNVISGHRDGFATECPGTRLYAQLGAARRSAAAYQGR